MNFNTKQVIDIIIFGVCLFGVLVLLEYKQEIGQKVLILAATPLSLIGLFFGFRAANAYKGDSNNDQ